MLAKASHNWRTYWPTPSRSRRDTREERDEALSALGAALDGGDAAPTDPAKADVWDGASATADDPSAARSSPTSATKRANASTHSSPRWPLVSPNELRRRSMRMPLTARTWPVERPGIEADAASETIPDRGGVAFALQDEFERSADR